MKLEISASLNYCLSEPVDLMLQIEAANGHGQHVEQASLDLGHPDYVARVPAADGICEPIWLHGAGSLHVEYRALVAKNLLLRFYAETTGTKAPFTVSRYEAA